MNESSVTSVWTYVKEKDGYMQIEGHHSITFDRLVDGTSRKVWDVLGPTVEFLIPPDDPDAHFCVMRGVVPPGVTVPVHSHDDPEDFFFLAGTQQVLIKDDQGLQWRDVHAGDYVHIPGGTPHAHRNVSGEPAIELVITTVRLGRFFQEVGRPTSAPLQPPTADELAQFVAAAARYGYTLGTAEENAAVGIRPQG